ncbi:hypothetical protein PG984_012056 [Apiospora sp. TS-2023a]
MLDLRQAPVLLLDRDLDLGLPLLDGLLALVGDVVADLSNFGGSQRQIRAGLALLDSLLGTLLVRAVQVGGQAVVALLDVDLDLGLPLDIVLHDGDEGLLQVGLPRGVALEDGREVLPDVALAVGLVVELVLGDLGPGLGLLRAGRAPQVVGAVEVGRKAVVALLDVDLDLGLALDIGLDDGHEVLPDIALAVGLVVVLVLSDLGAGLGLLRGGRTLVPLAFYTLGRAVVALLDVDLDLAGLEISSAEGNGGGGGDGGDLQGEGEVGELHVGRLEN